MSITGSLHRARRFEPLGFAVLAFCCVAVRLLFSAGGIEDSDGALFVLGVQEFDPTRLQPHWPGYPLYILGAKLFVGLGASPLQSLQIMGALGWIAVAYALRSVGANGRWAGWLVLCHPLFALEAGRIEADLAGIALSISAFGMMNIKTRRGLGAAGFLMGLSLGFRVAMAPFALGLFLVSRAQWRPFLAGLLLGVVIWLIPLVYHVGLLTFVEGCADFGHGHFVTFGGGLLQGGDGLLRWGRALLAFLPGGFWIGLPWIFAIATISLLTASRPWRCVSRIAALPFVIQSCFVLLFQNPDRPRHLLIPAVWFLLLSGSGLAGQTRRWPLVVASICCVMLVMSSVSLMNQQTSTPSPVEKVSATLKVLKPESTSLLVAGWSNHALSFSQNAIDVRGAQRGSTLTDILGSDPFPPSRTFVTHEIQYEATSTRLIGSARAPWVLHPAIPELNIHEILSSLTTH